MPTTGIQGSADFSLTLEDSPGGTPRAITLTGAVGLKILIRMMGTTALGDTWEANKPTGLRAVEPIPLEGLFNTTASTGAHVVLAPGDADAAPNSVGRQLVATVGDGKAFTVTGHLSEYEVTGQVGQHTQFKAVLTPDGAGVWA